MAWSDAARKAAAQARKLRTQFRGEELIRARRVAFNAVRRRIAFSELSVGSRFKFDNPDVRGRFEKRSKSSGYHVASRGRHYTVRKSTRILL